MVRSTCASLPGLGQFERLLAVAAAYSVEHFLRSLPS